MISDSLYVFGGKTRYYLDYKSFGDRLGFVGAVQNEYTSFSLTYTKFSYALIYYSVTPDILGSFYTTLAA